MRRLTLFSEALLSIALLVLASAPADAGKKVTICHLPPGNPENPQTITVGESAVSAHLGHGDYTGPCSTDCRSDASLCDDADACTSGACNEDGECVHVAVSCDDGNVCTRDFCDTATGCDAAPNDGASCDDGNACTSADACAGTTCEGDPIAGCCVGSEDCDDGDRCTIDACGGGICTSEPRDCAVADQCVAGFCDASGECGSAPVSCDDSDLCTDDGCNASTGCFHNPTQTPPQPTETLCPQAPLNDCEASIAEKECRRNAASCTDGTDNDCDGLLDGDDPDCWFCGDGDPQLGVMTPGACRDDFEFPEGRSIVEECDDGNTIPNDSCTNTCLINEDVVD